MINRYKTWAMEQPKYTALECFKHCWSSGNDEEKRARLESYVERILDAETEFEKCSRNGILHRILRSSPKDDKNFIEDMVWSYEVRFVGGPGSDLYNELRASVSHCCLCGGDTLVSTLDHHLPKSLYPTLAVTPLNLIPSCITCNKEKLAVFPATSGDQTLNPYFDFVEDLLWLNAHLEETVPLKISFDAEPCEEIPSVLAQKIKNHFKTFKLASRFEKHVPYFLTSQKSLLFKQFRAAGSDGLRSELLTIAEGYSLNSWQNATCRRLEKSHWYCEEGFAL